MEYPSKSYGGHQRKILFIFSLNVLHLNFPGVPFCLFFFYIFTFDRPWGVAGDATQSLPRDEGAEEFRGDPTVGPPSKVWTRDQRWKARRRGPDQRIAASSW